MPGLTNMRQTLDGLASSASADKLKGIDATILFDVTGDDGGQWTVNIDDGQVSIEEEAPESPDVTVRAASKDLKALIKGELNPMAAFMQGKLKVTGDMSLAMQMQKLFS
jgi:putative sterol carrier protein